MISGERRISWNTKAARENTAKSPYLKFSTFFPTRNIQNAQRKESHRLGERRHSRVANTQWSLSVHSTQLLWKSPVSQVGGVKTRQQMRSLADQEACENKLHPSVHYWWECNLAQPRWKTRWRFLKKKNKKPDSACGPAPHSWVQSQRRWRQDFNKTSALPRRSQRWSQLPRHGDNPNAHQGMDGHS